ncbi:hypothetical protein HPB51_017032 [Rhipicephalus microplus]|uniref:PDZ domain-containing protein n=1 Tax=Rhipicephalus microplus TaxID=6941 RepID=A0A9J6F4H1_RHIMP|nr:hypothetical protein HPB51_017032 [Rhipicephalus microplus]
MTEMLRDRIPSVAAAFQWRKDKNNKREGREVQQAHAGFATQRWGKGKEWEPKKMTRIMSTKGLLLVLSVIHSRVMKVFMEIDSKSLTSCWENNEVVDPGGKAEAEGRIRVGDLVLCVNEVPCSRADQAKQLVDSAFSTLTLLVWRREMVRDHSTHREVASKVHRRQKRSRTRRRRSASTSVRKPVLPDESTRDPLMSVAVSQPRVTPSLKNMTNNTSWPSLQPRNADVQGPENRHEHETSSSDVQIKAMLPRLIHVLRMLLVGVKTLVAKAAVRILAAVVRSEPRMPVRSAALFAFHPEGHGPATAASLSSWQDDFSFTPSPPSLFRPLAFSVLERCQVAHALLAARGDVSPLACHALAVGELCLASPSPPLEHTPHVGIISPLPHLSICRPLIWSFLLT